MDSIISSEKHDECLFKQLGDCSYSIGAFLGDGNLHAYTAVKNGKRYPLQCVRWGSDDYDMITRIQDEIETFFGKRYAIFERTLKSGKPFWILHAYRREIFDFFAVNTAQRTEIPHYFFSAPFEQKKALIEGMMDSDGYISEREFDTYTRYEIGFGNTTRVMVEQLAALMRGLNVKVGAIGEYKKGDYVSMWRINPNMRSFLEAGLNFHVERKRHKLERAISYMLGSETLYAKPASSG